MEALTLANTMGELRMNLRPFGEDTNEGADNGESFLSWINESEEKAAPIKPQQVAAVTTSVDSIFNAGQPPIPAPPSTKW
ncbi:MAG: hypothetical protein R3C56_09920 [Pirellulaceae bacterium]